jgi:hypothetical protein
MKLAWLTDIHLNFISALGSRLSLPANECMAALGITCQ